MMLEEAIMIAELGSESRRILAPSPVCRELVDGRPGGEWEGEEGGGGEGTVGLVFE